MADLLHASQERLRAVFRYLNRFMVMMWRLGLGRLVNIWPGAPAACWCSVIPDGPAACGGGPR
ncbi:MAG: hypothetical protein IPG94_16550 [Kineosporiaceae bacterium]|nr:hypothetical protein [Kineosporiaceae bacterium]